MKRGRARWGGWGGGRGKGDVPNSQAKALGQECERRPVGWSRRSRRGWGRTSRGGDHGQDLASALSAMEWWRVLRRLQDLTCV